MDSTTQTRSMRSNHTARLSILACDACRRRKVKCDARSPQCSNCRGSQLTCTFELPRRKRGPKVTRKQSAIELDVSPRAEAVSSPLAEPTSSPEEHEETVLVDVFLPEEDHQSPYGAAVPSADSLVLEYSRGSFGGALDPVVSPAASSLEPGRYEGRQHSPAEIQDSLISKIQRTGKPIHDVAAKCIDLFFRNAFPIVPVVYRPAILAMVPLLSQPFVSAQTPASSSIYAVPNTVTTRALFENMKSFTLMTSICSVMCAGVPRDGTADWDSVGAARAFLQASRDMLAHFEQQDIQEPSSTSLTLRIMQSSAFHNLGKTHMSLYVLGCAQHLALLMRLYDEDTFLRIEDPVEARLLRNLFWNLYVSDKSSSVLNNGPSIIHGICLDRSITVRMEDSAEVFLLGNEGSIFTNSYEKLLTRGALTSHKLWSTSSDVLLGLKLLNRLGSRLGGNPETSRDIATLTVTDAFMEFSGLLDDLPPWLKDPESHSAADEQSTRHQRDTFWTQRANLLVTYHCLKLILIRRAAEEGSCHLLGLTDDRTMLALRTTEVSSDLVAAATGVPFSALRANAEPCVEKLRQAGVGLLEVEHKTTNVALITRAKAIFTELLDLIARLNSKVSDELGGGDH